MPTLIPLSAVEPPLVESVLDEVFGTNRHARTAYRIREGTEWLPALSFAALDDEDYLVAAIQSWPVALADPYGRAHPLIMVGPVAVLPALQGAGYGKAMMTGVLGSIEREAPLPQVLIGDPSYYGAWGFTAHHTRGWQCPGPHDPARLLVRCSNPAVLPAEGMLKPWSADLAN